MTALLDVDRLTRRFGGLVAVNELTFSLDAGEIVGLLGPNGSGKTTALNLISGLVAPTSGQITFDGQPIGGLPANRISRRGIARTFQLVRPLPSLTVIENVITALAFRADALWGKRAEDAAGRYLEQVGLSVRPGQAAADLTYIDLKRLELARALAAEPKLLLLDEWLAGLNPTELRAGIELITALRQSGITVLLVEHVMDAVHALCERCVVMNAGRKIADGPTADVLEDRDVVRAYLGEVDA